MADGGLGSMLFHMNTVQDNFITVFVKGFLFQGMLFYPHSFNNPITRYNVAFAILNAYNAL
jgi:hypothetical protein